MPNSSDISVQNQCTCAHRLSHSSISRAPPTICFDFLRSLLHTYKFLHTAQIDNAARHKHRYFLWFSQFQLPLLNSPVTQLFLLILASVTVCHCWVLSCTWVVLYYLVLNMEDCTLEEHSMQDLCFQWGFTMFTMGQVCTKAPASPLFSFLKKSRTLCRMSGGERAMWHLPLIWAQTSPPIWTPTPLTHTTPNTSKFDPEGCNSFKCWLELMYFCIAGDAFQFPLALYFSSSNSPHSGQVAKPITSSVPKPQISNSENESSLQVAAAWVFLTSAISLSSGGAAHWGWDAIRLQTGEQGWYSRAE